MAINLSRLKRVNIIKKNLMVSLSRKLESSFCEHAHTFTQIHTRARTHTLGYLRVQFIYFIFSAFSQRAAQTHKRACVLACALVCCVCVHVRKFVVAATAAVVVVIVVVVCVCIQASPERKQFIPGF